MDSQRLKTSHRQLSSAVEVSRDRQQQVERTLQQMKGHADRYRQQIDQLAIFRQEYHNQLNDLGKSGISARQLQSYRHLINGIDRNIQRMEGELGHLQRETVARQMQWRQQRAKTLALELVVGGIEQQQQRLADRQEQRESDEIGQRPRRAIA